MTMPDERYRAVVDAERFLSRLAGGHYARVPKAVREEATALLRHYPVEWHMQLVAGSCPDVFQTHMEPLHKMVLQYAQDQEE
jgi:hypothetical protein